MTGQHVLGKRLKQCRIEARLTQEQLAHLGGCSDRVLRKADVGGSVRQVTIQRIVVVLGGYGQVSSLQELSDGPSAIARRFFDSCNQHGADLSLHFDLFADDLLVVVLVASSQLPFARRWFGLRSLESCLDKFFAVFWRVKLATTPAILSEGNQVAIRYFDQWRPTGFPKNRSPISVNWHLDFSAGKIGWVEHQFAFLAAHPLCFTRNSKGSSKRLVR